MLRVHRPLEVHKVVRARSFRLVDLDRIHVGRLSELVFVVQREVTRLNDIADILYVFFRDPSISRTR